MKRLLETRNTGRDYSTTKKCKETTYESIPNRTRCRRYILHTYFKENIRNPVEKRKYKYAYSKEEIASVNDTKLMNRLMVS